MSPRTDPGAVRPRRRGRIVFAVGCVALLSVILLLRLPWATDHLYHAAVKDPEREAPEGAVLVAPADGNVLYVRRVAGGVIPEVVKQGVPVPLADHLKYRPEEPFPDGYLVGIYMNTFGVHINRIPDHGVVREQIVYNGPHMDMTAAETRIILRQMVPGLVSLRKLLGITPYGTEDVSDFVLESARETLVLEDAQGAMSVVVRIADYYVGKILTWVDVGESVERGQRMGMITWGSQTDLFIEDRPGLQVSVDVGDYVYGGQTVVATYSEDRGGS